MKLPVKAPRLCCAHTSYTVTLPNRFKSENRTVMSAGAELPQPAPDSLEFFLVERYRLYSSAHDGLRRGAVLHAPYPLCRAEVTAWDENLLPLDGFAPTGRAPDHVIMSRGVDVSIFPLERVETV